MNDDILNAKNGATGGANPFNTNNTTNNNAANANTGSGSDSNPRFSGMPTMASQAKPQVQSQPVSQPVPLTPKPQFQPQPQASTQMPQAPRPQQPHSAPAVHASPATSISSAAPIAPVNPVMPRPAPIQAMPQKPYTPTPAPSPTPTQSYVQSVQAAPLPSSTQPSLQQQVFTQNAAYLKAQQMRQTNKGSSKGVLVTIIILLIIASAAGAIWFLKPANVPLTKYLGISTIMDMIKGKGSSTGTIEDKVANPEEQPAQNQNSAFPSGVINSGNQTGAQTNTAAKPVKPVTKTSNTYSISDQDAVASYIRNNINKIARTTGYAVTDITFDGPARAVVSYSKGSIVRSAVINTSISATGAVKVTGFTPLTK